MDSKILKVLLLLFTIIALIACSVGGKNEEELSDGSYYQDPLEVCEGPPVFTYNIKPDNTDETFSAYGKTQIRIIHMGQCLYNINLIVSSTGEIFQNLADGYGNINLLRVYDLPKNQYIIKASTDTKCTWNVEIESLEIDGCEKGDGN